MPFLRRDKKHEAGQSLRAQPRPLGAVSRPRGTWLSALEPSALARALTTPPCPAAKRDEMHMFCTTGTEHTLDELEARLRLEHPHVGLHELRLDALEPALRHSPELASLVTCYGRRVLLTYRPSDPTVAMNESSRRGLLLRLARKVAWVDLEHTCDLDFVAAVRSRCQVLRSLHLLEAQTPTALVEHLSELEQGPADAVKLAVAVDDPSGLAALLQLRDRARKPCILLGLGEAGWLSRARYPRFGSPWTYVALRPKLRTAEAQLTLAEAEALGLPDSGKAACLALLAGQGASPSPGVTVYNALFRTLGRSEAYVVAYSGQPEACLGLLRELGAQGVSVTHPHKAFAAAWAPADPLVAKLGAANTLRLEPPYAWNTDVDGIERPLAAALAACPAPTPQRALVLGAGGAAQAAVEACRRLGLEVLVCARSLERAAAAFPQATLVPWEKRASASAEVLVHATPIHGRLSPWRDACALRKRIVFDLAIGPQPSALLRQAQEEDCIALGPELMWAEQGAEQLRLLLGLELSPELLASQAHKALDARPA